MKITREVDGKLLEFELTPEEVYSAYLEKEHAYDCDDILNELNYYNRSDETRKEFFELYGVPLDKVIDNDELIRDLAYESRHNQDHFGMEWTYARDDALKDILSEHRLELIGLPERCYSILPSSGEIIVVARGESGYYRTTLSGEDLQANKEIVDLYNEKLGVSKAQAAAMQAGSMFGWDVPAVNQALYDENDALKPEEKRALASVIDSIEQKKAAKGEQHTLPQKEEVR